MQASGFGLLRRYQVEGVTYRGGGPRTAFSASGRFAAGTHVGEHTIGSTTTAVGRVTRALSVTLAHILLGGLRGHDVRAPTLLAL